MVQRPGPLAGDPPGGDALAGDPLASQPPAFGDEAARRILRDGFGVTGSLTALAGERDQNFRVDTAGGQRSEMPAEVVEGEVLRVRGELHSLADVGEERALHLHVAGAAHVDGDSLGHDLLGIRQHRARELAAGKLEHLPRLRALLIRPIEHREVGQLESGFAREPERRERPFRLDASRRAQKDPGVLQAQLAQQLRELQVAKLKIGGERQ